MEGSYLFCGLSYMTDNKFTFYDTILFYTALIMFLNYGLYHLNFNKSAIASKNTNETLFIWIIPKWQRHIKKQYSTSVFRLIMIKNSLYQGTWVTQSVKLPTPGFSLGHDLRIWRLWRFAPSAPSLTCALILSFFSVK